MNSRQQRPEVRLRGLPSAASPRTHRPPRSESQWRRGRRVAKDPTSSPRRRTSCGC